MTRFGKLALIILSLSILSYGFSGLTFAQQSPEDCGPNQVFQLGQCLDIEDELDQDDFTLKTDQPSYDEGDTIIITGTITTLNENFPVPVTLIIVDPDGNIVLVAQIMPDADGDFSTSFQAGGTMKTSGDYEIQAQYGDNQEATNKFSFTSSGFIPPPPPKKTCGPGEILVNGQCVLEEPELPECGPGEILVNGQCILEEPELPECGPGEILVNGQCVLEEPKIECGPGTELKNGQCVPIEQEEEPPSGCLIATAAFGSELAPQVQFLREIRDNTVMSTASGTSFMTGFNTLYYSFSPTIADWERQNPAFKEAVKLFITPMISSLSIMTLADAGSEAEVLAFGISVIALNLGMYIVAPTTFVYKMHKYYKSRK